MAQFLFANFLAIKKHRLDLEVEVLEVFSNFLKALLIVVIELQGGHQFFLKYVDFPFPTFELLC